MFSNAMKRKQWLGVLLILTLVTMPFQAADISGVQASDEYAGLEHQINQILTDERLDGAISSVSIRDAKSGDVVLSRLGDMRLKVASNMKLLTGAAALETLGPNYTFKTELLSDGAMKGKTLQGNLYLKGKGDPTLLEQDFDELAKELKRLGIKEVEGNLVADDTWYNDVRLSEDIMWNDEPYYYGAQISALTASPNEDFDAGTVIVEAYPTKVGQPADIKLTPQTDYPKMVNHTTTVEEAGPRDITITREHGTNNVIVEGMIPAKSIRAREWITLSEPTGYALDLFRNSLKKEGIKVKGNDHAYGAAPQNAELLYTKESMPLSGILVPYMKFSNNTIAEILVKEMGRVVHNEGSWEKGLEVVRDYLRSIGVNVDTVRLRDGSGISHVSNVPANELSKLLFEVQQEDWYPIYLHSFPVAGASDRLAGGTLRNRMKGTAAEGNVKAKTGSVTGSSSLSGYVKTQGGQELIFSIVLNNFLSDDLKDIEDKIAIALAEYKPKQSK
ncbi:D-alanyl-D-alanine carboxypeptidase/D-alanyl-D-alanine-endopeptidase [Bacillus songklensis]|uniref:D-alanyl-D-alanine carboxypeptidase/D-alanyl-D-alanine-endopeptidase n=1 Tax=Bacillus songklensis TaxID=1069116 RepID=A0ABV8AX76_9BACI